MLSDDLMLQMAFKATHIDNRFFRSEPLSTKHKLKRILPTSSNASLSSHTHASIYQDPDYGLVFEFVDSFLKSFAAQSIRASQSKSLKRFYTNKTLRELIAKVQSELNSLIVSEHFLVDRPKINVWSNDFLLDDEADRESLHQDATVSDLKRKLKYEFVARNEQLILTIVDQMCKLDADEFVKLNGLEMLLFLFEKHKYEESFLTVISNCLSLISLDASKRSLFVQSGWLKRLHQLCTPCHEKGMERESKTSRDNINMIRELIGHKVDIYQFK